MRPKSSFAGLFSLVVSSVLAGSCAPPLSELYIGVATDLSAPDLLDRAILSARREGTEVAHREWEISGIPGQPFELPGSFNVYTNDGSEPRVEVVLSGYRGAQEIVRRIARLTLVRGERKFLRMALVTQCLNKLDCPGERTCVEGRCVPAEVNARFLPTYQSGMEQIMSCDSGTVLRNTSTKHPLLMAGPGTCGEGERCREGTCIREEPSCRNRVRDGDETDVDCGGSCAACSQGKQCGLDGDCESNSCAESMCSLGAYALELLAGHLGGLGSIDGTGAAARFRFPRGLAYDGAGTLFVADTDNHMIRRVELSTGRVTTLAGMAGAFGSTDGIGAAARFHSPRGLAYDGVGTLFVADEENHTIRRVNVSTCEVTTLAGFAEASGSTDGIGTAARFDYPYGLTYDGIGTLFVADTNNQMIRRVEASTGKATTLAGKSGETGSTDGVGDVARFFNPEALVYDGAGALFVADTDNYTLRRVNVSTGQVTTLAGMARMAGSTDDIGVAARFNRPQGLAYDGTGTLFVVDTDNDTLRRVEVSTGQVTTLAGMAGPTGMGSTDGIGAAARFSFPQGLSYGAGTLFVADTASQMIRRVEVSTRQVSTIAGMVGALGYTDGTGGGARFNYPVGLSYDGAETLFVSDLYNHTIRRIVMSTHQVSTLAGMAGTAGNTDGIGTAALFASPSGLAYDSGGTLFVADNGAHTIRRVDVLTGQVTTLAGMAGAAGSTDDTGAAARFKNPEGLAYDEAGTLFVADNGNHTIRRVAVSTGEVTTLAGMAGTPGSSDGIGTAARFKTPWGLAYDGAGTLFVTDNGNHTIRRVVVSTGEVTTLAGMAGDTGSADGTRTAARFNCPQGLAYDDTGNLFVADAYNRTVRRVEMTTGRVVTVLGQPGQRGLRFGPPSLARLNGPVGIAILAPGLIAISDADENSIVLARGQ